MIHIGIDHHKKYSHVVALDDAGQVRWDGQIDSSREAFQSLKDTLPPEEPVQSVIEASWNWGIIYDALEEVGLHPRLANPIKTRMIAESFVKTDRIDATVHAQLLRAGMTPLVHVPPKEVRDQRNLLRRRVWLVKMQTALKNRIHSILDRNHLRMPEKKTDIFCPHGKAWMRGLELRDPEGKLLRGELGLMDSVRGHIRETEGWIDEALQENPSVPILMSLPGVGKILAAFIALEIDDVGRFASAAKLCSYSGLANSTFSSGGKTYHGGLIPRCNRHLRYAFIEAAWTAARVSPYFGAFHRRLKARKGTHDAIGATARKLCEIAFHCLKQGRSYEEKPYRFRSGRLGNRLA